MHPNLLRAYLLIILLLEDGNDTTLASLPDSFVSLPRLPEIDIPEELLISDIYSELENDHPISAPSANAKERGREPREPSDPRWQPGPVGPPAKSSLHL
jgi:hypothetical protein